MPGLAKGVLVKPRFPPCPGRRIQEIVGSGGHVLEYAPGRALDQECSRGVLLLMTNLGILRRRSGRTVVSLAVMWPAAVDVFACLENSIARAQATSLVPEI